MDATVDASHGQFELNDDQRAIRDMAEGFAAERVAPNALDWDKHKHFPADVIRETGPQGWLRVSVGTPEENAAFRAALEEVTA